MEKPGVPGAADSRRERSSIHDRAAVREFCRENRLDSGRLRPFFAGLYRKQMSPAEALAAIAPALASSLTGNFGFSTLKLERRIDSQRDGATRLLFRTGRGELIETVILRIASGRTTLCLSSQSGCAVGCLFCATGRMGLSGNLFAGEMIDQVIEANLILRDEGRRIRNLVFMGMGEPLHNEIEVGRAIEIFSAPDGFNLDQRRLLVSTSGIPAGMRRLIKQHPRIGLALSLHSATQQTRERLVPIGRRHPLSELKSVLKEITGLRKEPVMIEYVLLAGVNDADADAEELARFLDGLPVHVNLIPFNPIGDPSPFLPSPPMVQRRFSGLLKAAGFKVTTRYSLGADVAAACGQLAGEKERC